MNINHRCKTVAEVLKVAATRIQLGESSLCCPAIAEAIAPIKMKNKAQKIFDLFAPDVPDDTRPYIWFGTSRKERNQARRVTALLLASEIEP